MNIEGGTIDRIGAVLWQFYTIVLKQFSHRENDPLRGPLWHQNRYPTWETNISWRKPTQLCCCSNLYMKKLGLNPSFNTLGEIQSFLPTQSNTATRQWPAHRNCAIDGLAYKAKKWTTFLFINKCPVECNTISCTCLLLKNLRFFTWKLGNRDVVCRRLEATY